MNQSSCNISKSLKTQAKIKRGCKGKRKGQFIIAVLVEEPNFDIEKIFNMLKYQNPVILQGPRCQFLHITHFDAFHKCEPGQPPCRGATTTQFDGAAVVQHEFKHPGYVVIPVGGFLAGQSRCHGIGHQKNADIGIRVVFFQLVRQAERIVHFFVAVGGFVNNKKDLHLQSSLGKVADEGLPGK